MAAYTTPQAPSSVPTALCEAQLGTLRCSREAHSGRGHVYVTGSWVPDKHGSAS